MKIALRCGVTVAALALAGSAWAENPVWIGSSGNWSDTKKWARGVLPVEGDTVYVSNTVGQLTVNIDLPSVTMKSIRFEGHSVTGDVTVTGGKLILTSDEFSFAPWSGNGMRWDLSKAALVAYPNGVDFQVPVEFTSESTAGLMATFRDLHFRKSVTAPNATTFYFHNGSCGDYFGYVPKFVDYESMVYFHGDFRAPKARLNAQQAPTRHLYFYGPSFEADSIQFGDYVAVICRLMSTNTVIHSGVISPAFWGRFESERAGTYPANTVVHFRKNPSSNGDFRSSVDLGCVDRTFDRLTSDALAAEGQNGYEIRSKGHSQGDSSYTGTAPTTLTLRGTADAVTECRIMDDITVVWDPVGDHTQTFSNRTHTTVGSFVVRGGTMKLGDGGSIASARALEIAAGASFELESSVADPFPRDLIVTTTSRLKLNGKTVNVKRLIIDGVAQEDGTYTGKAWMDGEGSVQVAAGDCFTWVNAKGGKWTLKSNWLGEKAPNKSSQTVIIDAQTSGDITVVMNQNKGASAFPHILEIVNRGEGTTTLQVREGVTVTGTNGFVRVGRHARVEVLTGGTFHYETTLNRATGSATWHATPVLSIVDGGEWLTSGEVVFTNVCGQCWVNGEGSKLTVSAGKHTYSGWGSDYPLTIGAGARLELTGGTLHQPHEGYNQNTDLLLFGGTADFSGGTYNANVECIGTGSGSGHSSGIDLGFGTFVMRGTVAVNLPGTRHMRTLFAGTHLDWIVRDSVKLSDGNYQIGGRRYGDAIVKICGTSPYDPDKRWVGCGNWFLGAYQWNRTTGSDAGDGSLVVTSGNALYAGYYGVSVAGGMVSDQSAMPPLYQTGYLRVEPNALLDVYGSVHASYAGSRPCGITVGVAALTGVTNGCPCVGRAEIAGDVTNRVSLVVGGWHGRGTYVQEGGNTYTCGGTGEANECGPAVVGLGGGEGSLLVSNGCFTAQRSMWIGGCLTNDFNVIENGSPSPNHYVDRGGWPVDDHSARGYLEVSGGKFATTESLYVGADGTGVVSVVGSAGAFSVGRDLVLSNQTASILRFTADANGVAPIAIGGRLILTDASSLEVDLNACATNRPVKLFTVPGGIEGTFGKTTIVPSYRQLVRRGTSVYAINDRGLVLAIW